jgi:hypothetical protein
MRKFVVIAALLIATCGAVALAASVSSSDGGADIIAQWKLGRMYANGDGVKRDDFRAFEYFRGIADAHAEEAPDTPQGRVVAGAFVALGNYYLEGIPETARLAGPWVCSGWECLIGKTRSPPSFGAPPTRPRPTSVPGANGAG